LIQIYCAGHILSTSGDALRPPPWTHTERKHQKENLELKRKIISSFKSPWGSDAFKLPIKLIWSSNTGCKNCIEHVCLMLSSFCLHKTCRLKFAYNMCLMFSILSSHNLFCLWKDSSSCCQVLLPTDLNSQDLVRENSERVIHVFTFILSWIQSSFLTTDGRWCDDFLILIYHSSSAPS
jgi:hypothetical protein